jgi:glycosyltransferase involved in cell wall biosynthesis
MATFSGNIEKDGIKVLKYSHKSNQLLRLLHMCFGVIRHSKSYDYILIDTFSTKNFYYAWATSQIARLFKKKYIPILRGGDLPNRIKRSQKLSKMIFHHSYYNVAPSLYLKKAFEDQGYTAIHIPNILEIDRYTFKVRKELQPRLLWVRAFKHLYNPQLAIEVLKRLKDIYPEAQLCMIGPAKDDSYDEVQKLVKTYQLENAVEFTGVLSKEEWHKKSEEYDIFINTTNFDNTPVSVMEGMALGLPIVSTNVGGMPFLIENGVDGILVEKDNPEAMTGAIVNLLTTNDQDMIQRAREKAVSFAWKNVKKKWFAILS